MDASTDYYKEIVYLLIQLMMMVSCNSLTKKKNAGYGQSYGKYVPEVCEMSNDSRNMNDSNSSKTKKTSSTVTMTNNSI